VPKETHTQVTPEEIAHAFEEEAVAVDLKRYAVEEWVTLAVFGAWSLCLPAVSTRYVLNNSLAWTEKSPSTAWSWWCFSVSDVRANIAAHSGRCPLPLTCRARLGPRPGELRRDRLDCVLRLRHHPPLAYVSIVADERMVTIDLPRNIVFYTVLAAFALMLLRAHPGLHRRPAARLLGARYGPALSINIGGD
jgi:hypothetical protein